uniref:AMP-binding enzyme n=1 Tax=Neorhizobium sp. EC2-8 TaxID=3129230 RepID=UPI003100F36B
MKDPGTFDQETLFRHCRDRLSAYKVLDHIYVVSEIPRRGSGKIPRVKLRESLPAA